MIIDLHLHFDVLGYGSAGAGSTISTVDRNGTSDFLCCNVSGSNEAGIYAIAGTSAVDQGGNGKGSSIV